MSVIIYCRVSTEDQVKLGNSLEDQHERCEKYANDNNYHIKDVYFDVKSGKNLDREGLQEMLKNLQTGDIILVTALSRLSRNVADTDTLMKHFRSLNCHLISLTENLQRPNVVHDTAAFNQLEREMTAARTKSALQSKRERGEALGRPPYGYMYRNKKLIQNLEEQSIISTIHDLRDMGKSLNEIISELDSRSMKPRQGKWHPSMISRILAE